MQRDIETIRGQIAEIAAFQQTMMDTFNGFATDVMKLILALKQQANTTQQQILLILQRLDKQDERLDQQGQSLVSLAQTMRDGFASTRREMETIRQEMRDGFAAQAERHNELMMRVERLERRDNPPPERT